QTGVRGRPDRAGVVGSELRPGRHVVCASVDGGDTTGLRPPEPPTHRLSPLLHDRQPRRDPDPGAPPAQGAHPPGHEYVTLPAARRRPHGAGLRHRRLRDAALQSVRLLRGRTAPRVTYEEALRALSERGRFGIRLGLGRNRALWRGLAYPDGPI